MKECSVSVLEDCMGDLYKTRKFALRFFLFFCNAIYFSLGLFRLYIYLYLFGAFSRFKLCVLTQFYHLLYLLESNKLGSRRWVDLIK